MFMAREHSSKRIDMPVIYVVDDEAMLLDLAEVILEPAGFVVKTFRDPERALVEYAAATPPPQLLITDYAMGEMSGLDLMRECRKLHPDQKVLMVSGTVDESIYATADVKPDYFLSKPYDGTQFVAAVRALANG